MAEIAICWPRASRYEKVRRPDKARAGREKEWLVPAGNGWRADRITAAALYERLAQCQTPTDALAFANTFGCLRSEYGEPVREFLADANAVRQLLERAKDARRDDDWSAADELVKTWTRLTPQFLGVLGTDEAGRTQLYFEPRDLFSFIVAQLLGDFTSGKTYRRCERPGCGNFFYFGAGTGHRKRREGQPAYCTPTCRAAHAYMKRKEKERRK